MTSKPPPSAAWRWAVLVAVSVAMFGNYYAYDAVGPVADSLQRLLGFSDTQIGTLNAIYSLPNIIMVLVGGVVSSHKGVNLPGVSLPIPSLTRKDIDDLQFALELGCDFVALSFVRSASDVQALRTLIEASGSTAHVIAKIEKAEAVAVLDDIMRESDAVMVARGDLGVEIGAAEVPLLQKRIILRSLERGESWIPVTRFQPMLRPSASEPTPALHFQAVCRG